MKYFRYTPDLFDQKMTVDPHTGSNNFDSTDPTLKLLLRVDMFTYRCESTLGIIPSNMGIPTSTKKLDTEEYFVF